MLKLVTKVLRIAIPVGIIPLLVVLILPALRQADESAYRSISRNNLMQIGLGLSNYSDVAHHLPFDRRSPPPTLGWQFSILPYMDANPWNSTWDLNRSWDESPNDRITRLTLPYFQNPGVNAMTDSGGFGLTHYAGSQELIGDSSPMDLKDLRAGAANTVLAGEVATHFRAWGGPSNLRDPSLPLNSSANSFGRYSGDGAQLLMADGSVRFVANAVNPKVFDALVASDTNVYGKSRPRTIQSTPEKK